MGAGESLPDIENVVRMAETFGVTTDYLLKDGTDSADTQTAEQKTDWLRSACVFAVGLSAAGLVLITAAYYTWQSMLSMSIGFLVQLRAWCCSMRLIKTEQRTLSANTCGQKAMPPPCR
jgi:hypothetical protein